ncbi:MAG TPA: 50S ribosomal protein L25 [Candidatus Limnocylindrales bacterium]|jgi:large subunit ribosomal protein L25|nr:50S ribosomal protein L25 [Candidatus Limnocylindrales bacterium]
MADRPALAAERRTVTGKAVSRLRKDGRLPGVVFGHGTDSEPVSIDAHEFEQLRKHAGASTLVDLKVEGGKARPVLISGIQVHPVNRRPLHVDLFAVRMTEELTVEVQLVGTGVPAAVENGGTLVHPTSSVKVRALPANLPDSLTYDLSPLVDFDTTITVADLVVPEGVTIQADPAEVIARVLAPRVEEAVTEAAEGEAAEGAAEGESTEAAAEGESAEG